MKGAMIDGRSNEKKDFMSIAYETYKDFAENTSIHGLKYTVKSGIVLYERIFWILIVVAGLVGAGYMTVLFWNRYTSNPTRTSIQTAYAPTSSVAFPAVTICNINRIMVDKVENFMKTLSIPEDQVEIVERAFPQLLAFTNPTSRNYNMTELNVLHNVLQKNGHREVDQIMARITETCDEMFIKCQWNFEVYEHCGDLFKQSFTTDGICCSFNYIRFDIRNGQKRPKYSPYTGYDSGLVVLLNPMPQRVQYSSLHSAGLKVIIHSSDDYPGSGSVYKIVSVGRQSFLQISASQIVCSKDIRQLSIEQRQCAYGEEAHLKYFPSYQDTNCITECEATYFLQRCGCVPFYYSFTDKPICNISQIECLDESRRSKFDKRYSQKLTKACNCPSQCEDEFYHVLSTTTRYVKENSTTTSSFAIDKNITDDTIMLFVYFIGQTHTILYKDTITSTIYLLSSFGGVYSLFLGCSFITIVEIIYYCSFRLIVNLKILGRIDRTQPHQIIQPRENHNQSNKQHRRQKTWQSHGLNTIRPNQIKLWTHEGNIFLN